MADRLPSDHDAVTTHRVTIDRVGRTDRPQIPLPEQIDLEPGDVVELVLDGTEYHTQIESSLDGTPIVQRAADNPRLAREGEGANRLVEWFDASDCSVEGSVHLDVVTEEYKYGLRTPGSRVVYSATDAPDSSLADIARDLDG